MTNQLASQLLGYVCGVGGLVGVGAYIWVVLKRRRWLNSAGLLLTSLGLMQLSLMIHQNLGMAGLIQAALVRDKEDAERVRASVKAAAGLIHRNVVGTYGIGQEPGGDMFLTM